MENPRKHINEPIILKQQQVSINGENHTLFYSDKMKNYIFSAKQLKNILNIDNKKLNTNMGLIYEDYLFYVNKYGDARKLRTYSIEMRNLLLKEGGLNVRTTLNHDNKGGLNVRTTLNHDNKGGVNLDTTLNHDNKGGVNLDTDKKPNNSIGVNLHTDKKPNNSIGVNLHTDKKPNNSIGVNLHTDKNPVEYKPYDNRKIHMFLYHPQIVFHLVKIMQKASKKSNVKLNSNLANLETFLIDVCKVTKLTHNEAIAELNKLRERDINFNKEFISICISICKNLTAEHFSLLFNLLSMLITGKPATNVIYDKIDGSKTNCGMTVNKSGSMSNLGISRNYHNEKQSKHRELIYEGLLPFLKVMKDNVKTIDDPYIFIEKVKNILEHQCTFNLANFKAISRSVLNKKIKQELNIYKKNQLVFKEQLKLTNKNNLKGKANDRSIQ